MKINYLTPPSPTVLVSTMGNIPNLAPIGMFMVASTLPPMLLLGISPKTDTYHNIKKNHHFVIGIPNRKILNQLYQAGTAYGPDVNEFEITGLTPGDGSIVQAKLIMECEINFECVLTWEKETGDHMTVCGEVVRIHQKENPATMDADPVSFRSTLDSIYHVSGNCFAVGFSDIISVETETQSQ